MRRTLRLVSLLLPLLLISVPAATQARKWAEVLPERSLAAIRLAPNSLPGVIDVPPTCRLSVSGDSVRLVGGKFNSATIFAAVQVVGADSLALTVVNPPSGSDTMSFRLKEVRCSALYQAPEILVLEREGRHLLYWMPISPTTQEYFWTYPGLLALAPDGKPSPLMWDRASYTVRYSRVEAARRRSRAAEAEQARKATVARMRAMGWTSRVISAVMEQTVVIGMTKAQVRASWGEPDDINRTITAGGVHEQWVYGSSYVYFDNGVVTAIQD